MSTPEKLGRLNTADAGPSFRRLFVRDLELSAKIGVHTHERADSQCVRINVDLTVAEGETPVSDRLDEVVCYEAIVAGVKAIIAAGHINLVETLAERIAAMCLNDDRVVNARIRVEKLDVFPEAASVGVEIERPRRHAALAANTPATEPKSSRPIRHET